VGKGPTRLIVPRTIGILRVTYSLVAKLKMEKLDSKNPRNLGGGGRVCAAMSVLFNMHPNFFP
jgi:hypothetical protein